MKYTYYGHACLGVEIAGKHLLFDPFISPNGLAKDINIDAIKADYILVSHGHEDHVADVERIAKNTGAKVISNFEIISWFGKKGLEHCHPMNHGGKVQLEFGVVKYVNAVHSSALPDGTYGGNPGGFVVESDEGCFYYAGDTALFMDMQLYGIQHNFDVAILPIGDNFTMGYEDAALAAEFVKVRKAIGMHYDTFPMIEVDHEAAIAKFKNSGVRLYLPSIGETIDI